MATKVPPPEPIGSYTYVYQQPPVPRAPTARSHSHPGYYAVRSGKKGLESCIFLRWQQACRFVEDSEANNSHPRPDVAAFQDVSDAVEWLLEGDACAGENSENEGSVDSVGSGVEKEDAVTIQLPPPPPIRPRKRDQKRKLPMSASAASAALTAPEPRKKRGRPTKEEALLRDEWRREQERAQAAWAAERERKNEDDYDPSNWSEKLEQLRRYKERHGNLDIPLNYPVLGSWAERQRTMYREKCHLEGKEKVRSKSETENLHGSAEGEATKEKTGDQDQPVVPLLPPTEVTLEGEDGERKEEENSSDESEETAEDKTESGSEQKEARTSATVEQNVYRYFSSDNPSVSQSNSNTEGRPRRKDCISDAHVADLRAIGFDPMKAQTETLESIILGTGPGRPRRLGRRADDAKWEEMFEKYMKNRKGQNDRPLCDWLSRQRQNYQKFLEGQQSPLNRDRIRRLMQLGFDFEKKRKRNFAPQKFEDRLQQFIDYKKMNPCLDGQQFYDYKKTNPCLDTTPMSKELQSWIGTTRRMVTAYKAGRHSSMTAERLALLQQADFPFATKLPTKEERIPWDERFEQLLAFKAIHGHTNVHKDYEGGLGLWVKQQRHAYRITNNGKKKLTEERALHNQKLNGIGFVWKMQRHDVLLRDARDS